MRSEQHSCIPLTRELMRQLHWPASGALGFPCWNVKSEVNVRGDTGGSGPLLAAARRAGETLGLFRGSEQRLRLVDALLLLEVWIGVRDDAGAGLHIHYAVLDQRGAQHDTGVHL